MTKPPVDPTDGRTLGVLALCATLTILAAGVAGLAVRTFLWASGVGG